MTFFSALASALTVCALLATSAASAHDRGTVAFVAQDAQYFGTYGVADKVIAVDIDGRRYTGHFAERIQPAVTESGSVTPDASGDGRWGRAFLFASSADVLQCQLNAGFPDVAGQCTDAQGRRYSLARPVPIGTDGTPLKRDRP